MCVSECVCVHVQIPMEARRGCPGVRILGSCTNWVLGIEYMSAARAKVILNC